MSTAKITSVKKKASSQKYGLPISDKNATLTLVEAVEQDELKLNVKLWLKANNYSYAWLAEKCFVTESTVRNWMARKLIPAAKVHIIRELMKEVPLSLPSRVQVREETLITLSLDPATRKMLEKKAFSQGKTLSEFLADEVPHLGKE
jgi:hypothetical protein